MTYLIELTPHDRFFFGGSNAFGDDNHFTASERFPQNTQLLGALRRYILENARLLKARKNGLYIHAPRRAKMSDGKKAAQLVGRAGSADNPFITSTDIGVIESISPMFILKTEKDKPVDALFPVPLDLQQINKNQEDSHLRKLTLKNIAGELLPIDYNVKEELLDALGGEAFWNEYLKNKTPSQESITEYEKVYAQRNDVGIALQQKRIVEGMFYRKNDYSLKKPYRFGFIVRFNNPLELPEGTMQLGAERGLFHVRVLNPQQTSLVNHPLISSIISHNKKNIKSHKWVALGEARIDTHNERFAFAITPYFKVERQLEKYSVKPYRFKGKSHPVQLAPRGSVFYLEREDTMPEAPGAYSSMGYNLFIPIKSKGETYV